MESTVESLEQNPQQARRVRRVKAVVSEPNPLNIQPLLRWITLLTASGIASGQGADLPDRDAAFSAGADSLARGQIVHADPHGLETVACPASIHLAAFNKNLQKGFVLARQS
jgi:hypothetical protein